jgi:NAD(P)-dependent dehydrogenase (short-subunit alcohol dehydrogenase family)
MARLAGKVAVITGGGAGIRRATALLFAREGAKVAIAEINAGAGEETAHLAGNGAIAIRTDVTDEDSIRGAIHTAVEQFGALHILHNNAGGSTPQDDTVVDAPIEEFWRVIRLDLFGTFLGCRYGIPEIIKAGWRIGHQYELEPRADGHHRPRLLYRSKRRHRRADPLPRHRVRAAAGAGQRARAVRDDDRARQKLMEGNPAVDRLAKSHLLGLIEPHDIAQAALYLASDESRMVTGQLLPVDSGVTIS